MEGQCAHGSLYHSKKDLQTKVRYRDEIREISLKSGESYRW